MVNLRGAIGLSVAAALVLSAGLFAQKKDDKKQDSPVVDDRTGDRSPAARWLRYFEAQTGQDEAEARKKELQNVVKLVDDVAAGHPAPNDLELAWVHEDFLKAANNKDFVPFTVMLDPSKGTSDGLAIYWRVVARTSSEAAAPDAEEWPEMIRQGRRGGDREDGDREDKDQEEGGYPYEDVGFVPVTTGQAAPMQISRSFTVPAGSYDVFVVVKEPTPSQKNAPAPKVSVLKQPVNVPDFWNDELNMSSVMVAQRIDPLPAPLTPEEQAERPYALGTMELVPSMDGQFSKKSELHAFMQIYNPKINSSSKPDVTVEYSFYAKAGAEEEFFNKTNPQSLNAQTLPPEFDLAAGHQLQTGQGVPLASFPEGDYRLEVKVTDNVANKSLTRDVNFTVVGS